VSRAAPLAGAAGLPTDLKWANDARPGIRRRRNGRGFRYVKPTGAALHDAATLRRIRTLAIPPAYTDVWISPDPRGHIQATGRDARGRKQYRYHPRWREVRDATKFDRMLAFSAALPRIRRRLRRDLAAPGLPREKVLATIVQLLDDTCIRVGNEEYARANGSYGLTTLRDGHVAISGSELRFEFRGKLGKRHACRIRDRRLARIVKQCQDVPGQELFQYRGATGRRQSVSSGDVNAYLREISGGDFTAKDFRTWAGTLAATDALLADGAKDRAGARRRAVLAALDEVAGRLNNTRAVCRKYYVHPGVLEAYEAGELAAAFANGRNGQSKRGGRNGRRGAGRGLKGRERALAEFLGAIAKRSAKR
jgi:DNA topoisomerase-1